ncbi:MAG: penicillin-binding transpeptidase domain-containing protein, partial [Acidimicrobiales bacterium]
MNRRIRRLGLAFAVLYVVLFVQLNRVQFFGAERLQEHSINSRGLIRDFGQERGSIISADGVVIARSVEIGEPVDFRREYPEGDLYAHIAGYQSLNVAATGLERIYNDELAGVTVEQQFRTFAGLFSDRDTTATLHLTIRDDVQRAAREALGDRRGSVVALDPRTGAVVAMWTWPSFDPNLLADPDGSVANAAYEAYLNDSSDPLLAKSYRELFFPGSTFKLVTAAAGLESAMIGAFAPEFAIADTYNPIPGGSPIRNFAGGSCGGNLVEVLRVSCNTAFAEMGAEWVGPEQMIETAQLFG